MRELAQFKKVIENGTEIANPVRIHFPLKMKTWQYKGHFYHVLLNASDKAQPLPAALQGKSFKALYGRKKTTLLSPYTVLILKK